MTRAESAGLFGMRCTDQERDVWIAHQERNAKLEQEAVERERERLRKYKDDLIEDIMKARSNDPPYTKEKLEKMWISTLERIYDYL